ncbi:MAG: N-acetyltransferase [Deltaproteobacteria bacterium]|nr:N-acetyltransferase [Deltaproteobacteria bacterium]
MADAQESDPQISSSSVLLREARPEDDVQLCALMRRNAMRGVISLAADYEPSFFHAIEVEGCDPRVIIAESNRQIVGVVLLTRRRVFLNGAPADIGYAGSLRLDRSIRGTTIMARGLELIERWHKDGSGVPFYLFAILTDNTAARNVLASGRVGLPASTRIGTLHTAAIPLVPRRAPCPPAGIQILPGSAVGAAKLSEFLNRVGSEKQFFPVYTADNILADDGILRGLRLDDFYVATRGDRILGTVACWDQLPFRRIVIDGYSGYMRWLKLCLSPLARAFRLAPIPEPGQPLRHLYAACIAIEDNSEQVFTLLLNTILHHQQGKGNSFLLVGLMESDPLFPVLKSYLHIPSRSGIYALSFNNFDFTAAFDEKIPYVELGSL